MLIWLVIPDWNSFSVLLGIKYVFLLSYFFLVDFYMKQPYVHKN